MSDFLVISLGGSLIGMILFHKLILECRPNLQSQVSDLFGFFEIFSTLQEVAHSNIIILRMPDLASFKWRASLLVMMPMKRIKRYVVLFDFEPADDFLRKYPVYDSDQRFPDDPDKCSQSEIAVVPFPVRIIEDFIICIDGLLG